MSYGNLLVFVHAGLASVLAATVSCRSHWMSEGALVGTLPLSSLFSGGKRLEKEFICRFSGGAWGMYYVAKPICCRERETEKVDVHKYVEILIK